MTFKDNFIFQGREVAEFNTSQDSLRQIAQMEWNIDEMFRVLYSSPKNHKEIIHTLYNYITRVYADRLWSMSWTIIQTGSSPKKKTQEERDKEATFTNWEKNLTKDYKKYLLSPLEYPEEFIENLREYKRWLYEIKQKRLRLGIPTKTETTAEERFEKVAGV